LTNSLRRSELCVFPGKIRHHSGQKGLFQRTVNDSVDCQTASLLLLGVSFANKRPHRAQPSCACVLMCLSRIAELTLACIGDASRLSGPQGMWPWSIWSTLVQGSFEASGQLGSLIWPVAGLRRYYG
jgi:hypothetical protein